MSTSCPSLNVPIQTRVFDRLSSLLGFVYEIPCLETNNNRYLVLYDNFTARYHSHSEFHLCLCQDFRRHLLNIDYKVLRSHYQHALQNVTSPTLSKYPLNTVIRVKKFDGQYHNARVIEIDCSIIKICFFERKAKSEIWIHSNSSIIEHAPPISLSAPPTPTEDPDPDRPRLRKRKSDGNSHHNHNKKGNELTMKTSFLIFRNFFRHKKI